MFKIEVHRPFVRNHVSLDKIMFNNKLVGLFKHFHIKLSDRKLKFPLFFSYPLLNVLNILLLFRLLHRPYVCLNRAKRSSRQKKENCFPFGAKEIKQGFYMSSHQLGFSFAYILVAEAIHTREDADSSSKQELT